jgi:cytochrome P450
VYDLHSDADIDYQHSEHLLPSSINTITRWHSFWDPRILLNPLRPFVQSYHGNVINKYIRKELEWRFTELKAERVSYPLSSLPAKKAKANSAIALALEAYIADSEEKDNILSVPRLDDDFVTTVTHHIRLFLLAGNDTTASTLTFMFHPLSKHPQFHSQLRAEHDAIFGPDISQAGPQLKQHPALLNQCRYTLAVIKETLRLYPPSLTMRQGIPGFSLTMLDGVALPTEVLLILTSTEATHQNPRVWVRPGDFLPERWLAKPGDELYPPQGAYRPFDVGPRSCLGQTLSLIELMIVLILTVRKFEVVLAYEEWDGIQAGREGLWTKMASWVRGDVINTVNGDRAYQMDKAGAHPSEGYPCRVSFVE